MSGEKEKWKTMREKEWARLASLTAEGSAAQLRQRRRGRQQLLARAAAHRLPARAGAHRLLLVGVGARVAQPVGEPRAERRHLKPRGAGETSGCQP